MEKSGLIVTRFGGTHTYQDAIDALEDLLKLNQGITPPTGHGTSKTFQWPIKIQKHGL